MGRFATTFRELEVYQSALGLAAEVHDFANGLPVIERYAMADQIRRATRSICQNIAEAWRKRRYKAAFISKLSDAETEAGEVQSCLDLCKIHSYLDDELYAEWDVRLEKIISQLVTMANQVDKWCR